MEHYINPSSTDTSFDLGIYKLGSISGIILEDKTNNGRGDTPLAGVTVVLYNAQGTEIARTITDGSGNYSFTKIPKGSYTVKEIQPNGYLDVSQGNGDYTNTPTNTIKVNVGAGEDDKFNDFTDRIGGSIGDYVWNDTNGNGIQDSDENGVVNIVVSLEDENGNPILDASGVQRTTKTDSSGKYLFEGILPNKYLIVFTIPTGTTLTSEPQAGSDISVDSNPLETITKSDGTVVAKTPITMVSGDNITNIDMGLVYTSTASIGDFIWLDVNENGIFDNGENGVGNVKVNLYNSNNELVASTVTDKDGKYKFEHLPAGEYIVEVQIPRDLGYYFTSSNIGTDDTNSDTNIITGRTQPITVKEGEHTVVVDSGIVCFGDTISTDSVDSLNNITIILIIILMGLYFRRKEELV